MANYYSGESGKLSPPFLEKF